MPIGIGTSIAAAFGKSNEAPKPVFLPGTGRLTKPLSDLSRDALVSLRTGGAAAEDAFNAGTAKQKSLLGEQEGIVRSILNRRLGSSPEDLLRTVGNTAFGFIQPNVIDPLSRFDVNSDRIRRMAAGLSPGAIDSTAQRLRDARIASGRYYDTARQVYGALPNLYNQVFNAGVTNDEMASSYLPSIMNAYRRIDRSPLEAAELRSQAAMQGAPIVGNTADAIRKGVYGYLQPTNWADKLGAVDREMRASLQDAINMASQVYGGFLGGGAGGGMGGMIGGGGGGGDERTAHISSLLGGVVGTTEAIPMANIINRLDKVSGMIGGGGGGGGGGGLTQSGNPQPARFIPNAAPAVPAYPGYNPGPVNPYPVPAMQPQIPYEQGIPNYFG